MQPSQIMPSTVSVTVVSVGTASGFGRSVPRHAPPVAMTNAVSSSRLFIILHSPMACHIDEGLRCAVALHAELGEFFRDGLTLGRWTDQAVDVENAAIHADVERPTRRKGLVPVHHAVRGRHSLIGIAQQGVVDVQRLGERLVRRFVVDTHAKVRDVEGPYVIATLTE